jgi:GLPGLI family protein
MKIFLTIIAVILFANNSFGQYQRFLFSGSIEFEKRVNMHALYKKNVDRNKQSQASLDDYVKSTPQFKILKSSIIFANNKTLFTPAQIVKGEVNTDKFYTPLGDQLNVTYNDLTENNVVSQKTFFNEVFLLTDFNRKIKWKFTNETREIAGYLCHRANGIVLDSIYVVAFYADKIPVSGGPERFSGLPGMILEVALPHENITWYATKVVDTQIPINSIKPPQKGKALNIQQFNEILQPIIKSAGSKNMAQAYFKALML